MAGIEILSQTRPCSFKTYSDLFIRRNVVTMYTKYSLTLSLVLPVRPARLFFVLACFTMMIELSNGRSEPYADADADARPFNGGLVALVLGKNR